MRPARSRGAAIEHHEEPRSGPKFKRVEINVSPSNVHRHSKSPRADVSLRAFHNEIVLRIRDYGRGIPPEVLDHFRHNQSHGGVGLAGMRERIHELGGRLEMESDVHGTQVLAKMPRSERSNVLEASAD